MNIQYLNLFAGIGGNRLLIDNCQVTAIEVDKNLAGFYQTEFPNDIVITGNAYDFVYKNFREFDFIWASPPCQSHSKMSLCNPRSGVYTPDFRLYELIFFLQRNCRVPWVVENVIPYYNPLINHSYIIGRHMFWSNYIPALTGFSVGKIPGLFNKHSIKDAQELMRYYGFKNHAIMYAEGNRNPVQVIRNCVNPKIGEMIYKSRPVNLTLF